MLTRLSLRRSLPLVLGLFGLLFSLLLTALHLPEQAEFTLRSWRNNTDQHLTLLQTSLSDHRRANRTAEMETELADVASLEGVRWAMVIDSQLRVIASTRLDLDPRALARITPELLAERVARSESGWLNADSAQQIGIYPLHRVADDGAPLREALLVEFDFTPVLAATEREAWFSLGQTFAVLLLLGLLLNVLYNQLITRRLAGIEQAARDFADQQRPQPPAASGNDEIGTLARTLSSMMYQLDERQQAQRQSEQLMRDLIDNAPVGMLVVDQELRVQQANPAAAALFGCAPKALCGQPIQQRLREADAQSRLLRAPANTLLVLTGRRLDEEIPLEITCTPFEQDGERRFLMLLRDIGDRLRAEQRLRFLAHFDPLTRLANRNFLVQRLEQLLASGTPLCLLYLDLDHFKRINDTLGHEVGDRLLVHIAERLSRRVPAGGLLARSGGDEFMLLLEGADTEAAQALGVQLIDDFRPPLQVGQYECFISPSVGVAGSGPGNSSSASELLKRVDLALYAAKNAGRNRLTVFDPALSAIAERHRQLEQELRRALDRQEFVLHYQPQFDSQGRPQVMEALLRWRSTERGLVSPAEFIPVLEDSGMIIETTRWVFRQACRQARQWAEQGRDLRIAVNLSPLDFKQADLAGSLLAILEEEACDARLLELEITESALLEADEQVQQTLARLKASGMPLLLDDFGTGYASLTYLQRFPFDGIKIDREFVAGLPDSEHSVALVRGILTMASHLGLHVVAEGVENERQAAFLRLNGCPSLQGYYFARPQPAELCQLDGTPAQPRLLDA